MYCGGTDIDAAVQNPFIHATRIYERKSSVYIYKSVTLQINKGIFSLSDFSYSGGKTKVLWPPRMYMVGAGPAYGTHKGL
jgi:hypothetical protein